MNKFIRIILVFLILPAKGLGQHQFKSAIPARHRPPAADSGQAGGPNPKFQLPVGGLNSESDRLFD